MTNTNNESNENNNESTENWENTIQNETAEELLSTIAENIFGYYQNNKETLKWKSLEEIFFAYVENDKQIIEQVESKLWKELSFDDIKHLYLQAHYTLEESLTKDIFKHFNQKNAVKSVIKVFQKEINNKWFDIHFDDFLENNITSDEDIDELFKNIRNYLHNKLKNLSEKEKNEIKNIKITNEDIVNQLIDDSIIKNASYLEKNIEELKSQTDEEMQDILNIQNILLNANIINNINEIEKWFDEFKQDLDKITWFWTFSKILEKYKITEYTEVVGIALEQDINLYLDYIKNHEEENNEKWLAQILKKTINNEVLTDDEKVFVINLFKQDYIENISKIVSKSFKLTKEQEEIYKNILEQLLDPSKNSLGLPNNININIKKNVKLPETKNINELFDMEPTITFDITWNDVNYFRNVFPNYFKKIGNEYYSIFSKVKIKDKDWNTNTWYIQESINSNEIEIYENNPINNSLEPIKTINTDDIQDIELQEENKLKLDSRSDLRKLSLWMVSYFPELKKDYNYYKLKESLDETKEKTDNQDNETDNIDENTDYEINPEKFKKEWSHLEWNEDTEFKIGSIIQIKWKALDYPWITSNWFYGKIIDINENTWYFKIKLNGGWLLNFDKEWEELQIPMIAKWITKMKFEYWWNIFKFNKIDNIQDFWKNLKNIHLKSDFQWLQQWLSLWANNIEVKDNKLVRKNEKWEYEEIKYIWNISNKNINNLSEVRSDKAINEKFNVWEIDVQKDYVILKYPYDKTFSRKLDLNTFLILIMQNKLEPWTEKNFITAKENVSYNPQSNENKLRFFSFNNIILSFKQLKESFSYYFKEDDELRAAEMYAKMAWSLPDFWFFSDIKMETGWEKESKIWRIIENAKSRLERTWEWKGKNHGKVAANIVKKEIFEKVKQWKKLSYRTRLKAAWYLIYALEQWPWPYFRALADYEGQWYWVKALLGEDHYKRWNSRTKQLQEQLKKDPWNEAIRDQLIKSEIFYIKDLDECASMYTTNFWATIEWLTINSVYSWWKVQEVYEWESTKWNYFMIRDWLKSYILNNRPSNSLWALKAISERVDSYDTYIDYYKLISSFIFTWYLFNNYNIWFREQFDKICRTYWIPIWLFAKELHGINKVLKIFDYIVKKKNIKPWGKDSFTEFLYGIKNPDSIDVFSINSKGQRANIMKKLEEFWTLHWESIVSSLDDTDMTLLKWTSDNTINEQDKEPITEYFNKVNDNITEDFTFNDDLAKTAYAPYYQNWIFNVPAWPFQHIALDLDSWRFHWKNKSIAEWVWKWIEIKLEWIQDVMDNDEVYEFLIKKFINWFGRFYIWEKETELIKTLKSWDSEELNNIIIDFNKHNYWDEWKIPPIPPEMETWLKQFAKCFQKRPRNIDKVLSNVFGKDKIKDNS